MIQVSVLGSGSRGNCTFVQAGRTRVLVDAGFSCAEITRRLATIGQRLEDVDAILVTHEHSDHLGGVRVIAKRHGIPVACNEETLVSGGLADGAIPEWIPVLPGRGFHVGDIAVDPFEVPHDASVTLGFRLNAKPVESC